MDLLDYFKTIILQSSDAHATAAVSTFHRYFLIHSYCSRNKRSNTANVYSQAIEALALNCFVAGETEVDTQTAMQLITSVFDKTRSQTAVEVLDAALNAWGLLATVAPIEYLVKKELNKYVTRKVANTIRIFSRVLLTSD